MKESNNNSIGSILIAVIVIVFIVAMRMCGVKTTREQAVENALEEMHQSTERLNPDSLEQMEQKLNELIKRKESCNNN